MRTLVLLIFLTAALRTQAQTGVYHPFPDSGAVWNTHFTLYWCTFFDAHEEEYSYTLSGDTIIGANVYHKLIIPYVKNLNSNCMSTANQPGYKGGIRQDIINKKVFIIPAYDSVEQVLYNFNLQIGDTVPVHYTSPFSWCPFGSSVAAIDSVLVGLNYRKRWICDDPYFQIIEGIGSVHDLLIPLCQLIDGPGSYLNCFSQNGIPLYPDTTTSCNIITKTKNIVHRNTTLSLSPNPFHTTAILEIKNTEFSNAVLKIYDRMGRIVQRQIINSPSTIIHRNLLADGIYFYQLVSDKGQMVGGKFVME